MQDAEPNFPPYFKKFIFYSAAFHGVVWVVLFFLLSTNIQAPVETQVTWVQVGGPVSQDQTGGSATSEETGDKPSAPVKKEEVKPQPAKPSPPAK